MSTTTKSNTTKSTTTRVPTSAPTTPALANVVATVRAPATATSSAPTRRARRTSVFRYGIAAAVVASIATTTGAALASAAGVSFADRTGAGIPIAAFAELTLVFSLIGVCLAAVMVGRARRPRSTFTRTALTLTALSFVPDLTFGFDAASAATLITLHSVAAAIMVPTLAKRLAHTR
jgi:hypothetical protein